MIIQSIKAREILDSRGLPTIEVTIKLSTGQIGVASVPSGSSTGSKEALELRDGDNRYCGYGVLKAVHNVNSVIANSLCGMDVTQQSIIDNILISLDGTPNKSNLGANAILAVSLAVSVAAANFYNIPLYRYVGGLRHKVLPIPMMNIINGGAHANNKLDIQEFMILPVGVSTFSQALHYGVCVFQNLKKICNSEGFSTAVGDEGGFAPNIHSSTEALDLILRAVEMSGLVAGDDIAIGLDCAASEFYKDGFYQLAGEELKLSSSEFVGYLSDLVNKYPIISIEDGMSETDIEGWVQLTQTMGDDIQLIGDDIFVTNVKLLSSGINGGIANAILIKPNQIGTLTETIAAVETAKHAGYNTIMSHRSGETESSIIADLAVGLNCGQIKAGSLSRSDRVAKYNRLLWIEEDLGEQAIYAEY